VKASVDKLSESELLQNCVFILNAGHETTTNLIGNALVALQERPAALAGLLPGLQRLADDPQGMEALLTPAVDEFLRFESSNQLSNRRALVDARLAAWTCPPAAC
jgi:cytochrome P450